MIKKKFLKCLDIFNCLNQRFVCSVTLFSKKLYEVILKNFVFILQTKDKSKEDNKYFTYLTLLYLQNNTPQINYYSHHHRIIIIHLKFYTGYSR